MNDDIKAKNESGIYEVYNIKNGKRYIGQSIHIRTRLLKHRNYLRNNEHVNEHLQNSWNKYGENSFEFNVIEYCSIEELDSKENYYIEIYNANNKEFGYNHRIDNLTNRGLKWTDQQREKINKAIEKNPWYHNHAVPRETMEKAWAANRGRKHSEEERRKQSESSKGHKKRNTENMKLAQQGSKNPSSKLTEEDVKEIICLCESKRYTHKYLADVYGVSHSTIGFIFNNKTWRNIDRSDIDEELYYLKGVDRINDYSRANQGIA